ncbi:MAG: RHS repeat domain-containing protein [Anaerolineae bacterium]
MPTGRSRQMRYDAAGNVIEHQLADGQINRYSYDAMNRQIGETISLDGQINTTTYVERSAVNRHRCTRPDNLQLR